MPLPDLDILVAVADAGSLSEAAHRLSLPRPTLSRRLTKLEEDMGAGLVLRSSRGLTLTPAGQALYEHARPIVAAIESATTAVRASDGTPRGLLRVSLPPGGKTAFDGLVPAFLDRYPEVRVEVLIATRFVHLIEEGFDVAVRAGPKNDDPASLISRTLQRAPSVAVASPQYLDARGRPATPSDLGEHACLVSFDRSQVPLRRWPLADGSHVAVNSRLASNDLMLLYQAALNHQGIALVPAFYVQDDLEAGHLEQVLPDALGQEASIRIVFPEKRRHVPRVRAFVEHCAAWMERNAPAPPQ